MILDYLALWLILGFIGSALVAITDGLTIWDLPMAIACILLGPVSFYMSCKHCIPARIKNIELVPWHWNCWRRKRK